MPPLSLTQLKYASAMLAPSVKSVPGCLVTIAPTLIGVPVAFVPGFVPHLVTSEAAFAVVVLPPTPTVDVLLLLSLPHAAINTDRPATSAISASPGRHLLQPKIVLTCDPPPPPTTVLSPRFAKRTAVRKTNLLARLARSQGASAACLGEVAQGSRGPSCSPATYALTGSGADSSLECGAHSACSFAMRTAPSSGPEPDGRSACRRRP